MRYAAVLFDLDGTLLDTLADLANSVNRVLAGRGFPTHPVDAYRRYVGDGVFKLIERALPAEERNNRPTFDACLNAYREDYARNWKVDTQPYPGIAPTLDALVDRGVKLAVLSNKPDEFTQLCVTHFLGPWKFDVVLGATSDFPHKPDPASALEVARRLSLSPAQILYLGDTATDMQTARAAGMTAVGATWGFRTRQELQQTGASILIDRPQDLLKVLDGMMS